MSHHQPRFALRLAATASEVRSAQALRYKVFVQEKGGRGGACSDDACGLEKDRYDPHCQHLLLLDPLRDGAVVGTTRILTESGAAVAGGFATEDEFDLAALRRSGRRLLEVGRTCLHPDYRGGEAMHRIWQGLAAFVTDAQIDLIFGLASFPGGVLTDLAQPLACLHHEHLAPEALRPVSRKPVPMDLVPRESVDRRTAMLETPALVKAYLRLGGKVGHGAYQDRDFGCFDVCMVLDTATMSERARGIYARGRA